MAGKRVLAVLLATALLMGGAGIAGAKHKLGQHKDNPTKFKQHKDNPTKHHTFWYDLWHSHA